MPSINTPTIEPTWLIAAAVIALITVVVWAVLAIVRARRVERELDIPDPVPLVIPVHRRGVAELPFQPLREPLRGAAIEGPTTPATAIPQPTAFAPQPETRQIQTVDPPPPPTNGVGRPPLNGNGKIVQSVAPSEGTLQFLPGRLEVMEGDVPGRDIRFVRTWGEIPEVTFGRVAGPPYRHVQLRSQTISRQHARMQYVEGRWKITNLSQTNPVVINGEALDTAHGQRVLHDGDQIEMGDVLFRFRER
jgi:pSer/pThr/pTyr-binding forkhead associated (FHA) protein